MSALVAAFTLESVPSVRDVIVDAAARLLVNAEGGEQSNDREAPTSPHALSPKAATPRRSTAKTSHPDAMNVWPVVALSVQGMRPAAVSAPGASSGDAGPDASSGDAGPDASGDWEERRLAMRLIRAMCPPSSIGMVPDDKLLACLQGYASAETLPRADTAVKERFRLEASSTIATIFACEGETETAAISDHLAVV